MADVKWIKVSTGMFESNRKIKQIEMMPEGDTILVIWLKLLLLAGNINDRGAIYITPEIPYTEEMLANEMRRPPATVRMALSVFQSFGMIEIIDDVLYLSAWEKYQNTDGLEKIREQNRKRKQVQRARQKEQLLIGESNMSRDSHGTVTQSHAIDKEIEREEEIEGDKKKKSVKENTHTLFERLLPDYNIPFSVSEKLKEWFTYKTERKEPYKEQGMKSFLRQIENKSAEYGEQAVCDLIDECMSNGWKGIIYDRLEQKKAKPFNNSGTTKPQNSNNDFFNELNRIYNEE